MKPETIHLNRIRVKPGENKFKPGVIISPGKNHLGYAEPMKLNINTLQQVLKPFIS
jgi:hypothetical protein